MKSERTRYTKEEQEKILQYFSDLKGDVIRQFLSEKNLPRSGTKPELREKIENWLGEGNLQYEDLVLFLDRIAPWGKQHIILYNGPDSEVRKWCEKEKAENILNNAKLTKYLNSKLLLMLPEKLSFSSIEYSDKRLRILAVKRREAWERAEKYDQEESIQEGKLELRAFLIQVTRAVVVFTWDFISNNASLQITQLPSREKYEDVENELASLMEGFLDLSRFDKLNLRPVIKKLHELEQKGSPEARSHTIAYQSAGGRKITAESPTPEDSVLGEDRIDTALESIRSQSVGHIGNFYWLPTSANSNPLRKEIHTIIVGNKSRINFTTPNEEDDVEYVLSRVRALSQ